MQNNRLARPKSPHPPAFVVPLARESARARVGQETTVTAKVSVSSLLPPSPAPAVPPCRPCGSTRPFLKDRCQRPRLSRRSVWSCGGRWDDPQMGAGPNNNNLLRTGL